MRVRITREASKGVYRMEMMIVLSGLMSMMVMSLAFQHFCYRKVQVNVSK